MRGIAPNSFEAVVTDPPYFLDRMDDAWDADVVADRRNMKVVTSLPSGMRFDRDQGKRFYDWYVEVSKEIYRVIKPGGFFFSFSSPRLYHRMACAVEDAGFLIRDQFVWLYTQNQPKAMALNHVIDRLAIPDAEKADLKSRLAGWKTPQVKSCHEPIVMAQKPLDGSFLDNYREHGTGLVDTAVRLGQDMFPANVMASEGLGEVVDRFFLVPKPSKREKGEFNIHKTVKPVELCRYLIALTTRVGDTVLDPFAGSGSTCVAAKDLHRNYVGIDLNEEYVKIANRRLGER